MPAIYLFQRRTLYGGDDLHVLALVTGAVRFFQLCCYAVLVYHIVHHVQHNMHLDLMKMALEKHQATTNADTTEEEADAEQAQRMLDNNNYNNGFNIQNAAANCNNSHLFPILLMSYTASGIVFCVASCVLLVQIYTTSSQGCPTLQRHPRTETMEQLLEWLFLPLNGLHALVCMVGLLSLIMAYTYVACDTAENGDNNNNDGDDGYRSPSTAFTVFWVLCALLNLISQAIEIFWNASYVLALYYHDPHALVWTPHSSSVQHGGSTRLQSYHHSSSNGSLSGMMDTALQAPSSLSGDHHHNNHELIEQMWADRCQNCCRCLGMGTCYVFGGRELYGSGAMHYGDFARAMADYLETRGVLDVVPSDIIVGFMVLQQLQTQRRHEQRREVISEHSKLSLYTSSQQGSGLGAPSTRNNADPFGATSSLRGPQVPPSQQQITTPTTDLHNHRADANGNSPNGMRLQVANNNINNNNIEVVASQQSNVVDIISGTDSLLQPPLQQQQSQLQLNNQERTVRMLSMGAGSMPGESSSLPFHDNNGAMQNISGNDTSSSRATMNENMNPYGTNVHNISNNSLLHNGGATIDHSAPPPKPSVSSKSLGSNASSEPPNRFKGFQRVLSAQNHADSLILQEGARYSKYALAIYTWYLYLYVHPVTGIPRLCAKAWNTKNCSCCFSGFCQPSSAGMDTSTSTGSLQHSPNSNSTSSGGSSNASPRVSHRHASRWEGDNICQAHKNALLLTAGLENEADLVYVQLKSSFNENPYCILLDHETQAVVVAIRGTFSLEDCVTDVLIEPESLESLGDEFGFADIARGQHCHGGVLASARNIYRDLKRHGSLDYLLGTKYPHYQLRLVGHSLGAACSTMLGFMMRQTYPNLQCFNYSPPGCTVTWELAIHCQSWCTSFVLDTEVVPRLSFESLENLRDEVLELIGRIRVSKIEVARRVATNHLWCRGKETATHTQARHEFDIEQAAASVDALDELLGDLLLPLDEMPPTDSTSYRQQLDQFQAVQSERRSSRGTRRAIRLFPPGKILHLVKTDQEESCMVHVANCLTCCTTNAGSRYTPVWIGNGDLNEIVIGPTMGTDHFPDRMMDELDGIVQNYGLSSPFR